MTRVQTLPTDCQSVPFKLSLGRLELFSALVADEVPRSRQPVIRSAHYRNPELLDLEFAGLVKQRAKNAA